MINRLFQAIVDKNKLKEAYKQGGGKVRGVEHSII